MRLTRVEYVELLWNMTLAMNVLHPDDWSKEASRVLDGYTMHVRRPSYRFCRFISEYTL